MKSPPELWAEISDAGALAGHLGAFGEIRITRLDPETTVAWEGDRARGTVELEPAGWGTKVTLTARIAAQPAAADPEPVAADEPEVVPEPEAAAPEAEAGEPRPEASEAGPGAADSAAPRPRRRRRWWPFGRRRAGVSPPVVEPPAPEERAPDSTAAVAAPVAEPDPEPAPEGSGPETTPASLDASRATEILSGVLDDLGAAHHRPFSRG